MSAQALAVKQGLKGPIGERPAGSFRQLVEQMRRNDGINGKRSRTKGRGSMHTTPGRWRLSSTGPWSVDSREIIRRRGIGKRAIGSGRGSGRAVSSAKRKTAPGPGCPGRGRWVWDATSAFPKSMETEMSSVRSADRKRSQCFSLSGLCAEWQALQFTASLYCSSAPGAPLSRALVAASNAVTRFFHSALPPFSGSLSSNEG